MYKYDEKTRTLTIGNDMDLYEFQIKHHIAAEGEELKKLVITGEDYVASSTLTGILEQPTFDKLEEIKIGKKNGQVKAINNIIYSKDGKELIFAPKSTKGKVVIPEGVEIIQFEAFKNTEITEVEFPESLREIDESAFKSCQKLEKIDTKNVEVIGDGAFNNCVNLKNVTLGNRLKKIDFSAFARTGFTSIKIPESVKRIEGHAFFKGCLKEAFLPESIDYIGIEAFETVEKVHIKKYIPNMLKQCTRHSIRGDRGSEALVVDTGKEEVVFPKNAPKDIKKISRRFKQYLECGDVSLINDMFVFAHDDNRKICVAIEILKRYDSEPAVKFLNDKAGDIAMRCNTEEMLIRFLGIRFWTDEAIKKMLDVAVERGWIKASAYALEEIGKSKDKRSEGVDIARKMEV